MKSRKEIIFSTLLHHNLYHVSPNAMQFCAIAMVCIFFSFQNVSAQVDAEVATIMGRNALSVDDYVTAVKYFNQAIEAKPFLSRPYYYRAYAKFTLEDYVGAEADCSQSISLNPYISEVYQLRGLCRIHLDDYDGSIADYSRVLRETPDDQGARYNRALCYLQQKNYAQADSDLTYIVRHWPTYSRTYLVKAQSAFEQKDTLEGLKWIDHLLALSPKEAQAWSFKGRYALQKSDYSLADSCLTQALKCQSNDFEAYVARAQARHALNKFGLAIADYDKAIELVPQHFVAHYNRGLLRSFVGDLNKAILDFDFVLQVEPDNTLALFNRAQLREKVGNYRGAIADYSQLIKAYPNFTYGYLQRASCRRKIGDKKGAVADETYVARRDLDIAFARAPRTKIKKVRLRSEHALEQYQQLIEEDPDTARNVFGTMLGKVQNEKVSDELCPMFHAAFRPIYTRGYHSVAFMAEMAAFATLNTPIRQFCLTAESETLADDASESDWRQVERVSSTLNACNQLVVSSAIAVERYNYTSALNDAQEALRADSTSVLALLQCAFVLSRSAASGTMSTSEAQSNIHLAQSLIERAKARSPKSAVIVYNQACLMAQAGNAKAAIETFGEVLELDERFAEAYYNRAILLSAAGEAKKAATDFSKAGQLGLYKAYAQMKKLNN